MRSAETDYVLRYGPGLIFVEAMWSACVKSFFPGCLDPAHLIGGHVGRHSLQNCEAKVARVTAAQQDVTAMAGSGIIHPPAVQIILPVGRTYITSSVRHIVDEVDASPVRQRLFPSPREFQSHISQMRMEKSGNFGDIV